MKYALYTGCAAKGACPELYQSSMKVIQKLGLEVVELKDATCCGAGVIREGDPELSLAINARTFSMAESMGLNVMTICGTCQGVMASTQKQLKEEEGLMDRVNALLAMDHRKYGGTAQTKHLLWILAKEIGIKRLKEYVVRPLDGLRVMEYPVPAGCIAGYYPECNPLLPLWHHAKESFVPAAKSISVRIEAAR